jgi:hypothetical protein
VPSPSPSSLVSAIGIREPDFVPRRLDCCELLSIRGYGMRSGDRRPRVPIGDPPVGAILREVSQGPPPERSSFSGAQDTFCPPLLRLVRSEDARVHALPTGPQDTCRQSADSGL